MNYYQELAETQRWVAFVRGFCALLKRPSEAADELVRLVTEKPETRDGVFAMALDEFKRMTVEQRKQLVTLLHGLEH